MSRSWEGGSTRAWRRTRALVLTRDHHRCQLTLPGCTTTATEVHHQQGKGQGDDPASLVAACGPCNRKIGDPTTGDPRATPRTQW